MLWKDKKELNKIDNHKKFMTLWSSIVTKKQLLEQEDLRCHTMSNLTYDMVFVNQLITWILIKTCNLRITLRYNNQELIMLI